jgi:hypothetical protein
MMKQNAETRIDRRKALEAVARWNERQAMMARRNGDVAAVERFSKNAMSCRLRQR